MFTIGFNGENVFFSHCKKLNVEICVKHCNVYYYEDNKTKKNNFYSLKSEILLKMSKTVVFAYLRIDYCDQRRIVA